MNTQNYSKYAAQGAAAWNEKIKHDDIIKMLDEVYGYMAYSSCDYGHCGVWRVKTLPDNILAEIVKRGKSDEIIYMIERYAKATPPQRWFTDCNACHPFPTTDHILPEKIQEMIAKRGIRTEIRAYIAHNGFGPLGQDVIIERGDNTEIMEYIDRHGLLEKQQRKLLSRNKKDEVNLHILRHGLHPKILEEMFDDIKNGGNYSLYHDFIIQHELPVESQKLMLQSVSSPAFGAYIDRYGLWEDAHTTLLEARPEQDVINYIRRHRFLSPEAERLLAQKGSTELKMFYIKNRVEHGANNIENFTYALLSAKPINYELIALCFEKDVFSWPVSDDQQDLLRIVEEGRHGEIINMIASLKHRLCPRIFAALFFRQNEAEFLAYAAKAQSL